MKIPKNVSSGGVHEDPHQPMACLFVCLQDYAKDTQPAFTKFGGKVAHGPREETLDYLVVIRIMLIALG